MKRRKFISASAVFLATGCLGNDENHELRESEFEPIDLVLDNPDRENTTVSVEITQDGRTVYSDELEATRDDSTRVESVIEEEGEYVVRAELNGMSETENVRISSTTAAVYILLGNETVEITVAVE
jgi:hypothetical protein